MRLVLLRLPEERALVYCQRTAVSAVRTHARRIDETIADKAAAMWRNWESGSSSIKKQITVWGNAAVDKIPYEEWSLKGVPRVRFDAPAAPADAEALIKPDMAVQVVFPRNVIAPAEVPTLIMDLVTRRRALDRRLFWWSLLASPFTLPLVLLPVVPNVPGFYLLYRAWSHWKALEGGKTLERLVAEGRLDCVPSAELEAVYAAHGGTLGDAAVREITECVCVGTADDVALEGELRRALAQLRQ
ncbi:mitochondrial K+-H+ exchange-related-domain-containing protein [Dipodascopsis tothii]|uniref:mitochondrial K+-H+ exchange-related-domain-containing protein n=1 Tax=Dipodascopsis tothii TaxID=44089 RepID=UPI0034CEE65F